MDSIVLATWGLVVVTTLLVIASTVPALINFWKAQKDLDTRFVPDMHILNSRLEGAAEALLEPATLSAKQLDSAIERSRTDLRIVSQLAEIRDAGLAFTNEIFICRHLITFASDDLRAAAQLTDSHDEKGIRERDAYITHACRAYKAASLTLKSAEVLLPQWATQINGEAFWDRFARLSDEREREAERWMVDGKRVDRTRGRRPRPS